MSIWTVIKLTRLALCALVVAVLVLLLWAGPHENRENWRGVGFILSVAFTGGLVAGSFWAVLLVPVAMFATNEIYRSIHHFPDSQPEITGVTLIMLLLFLLSALAAAISAGVLASKLVVGALRWLAVRSDQASLP